MRLYLLAVCIFAIAKGYPLKSNTKNRKKGISLDGATTIDQLKDKVVQRVPTNLTQVLAAFNVFTPVIVNDLVAIQRVAYEMCEDSAKAGVVYFEARYAPRLLITQDSHLTSRDVILAVYRGFQTCKQYYDIDVRQILCLIRTMNDPEMEQETLQLADEMRKFGVAGIDVAGVTEGSDDKYSNGITQVFQAAANKNIHRTAHAGESGSAEEVQNALTDLRAERIGHGYRVMQNMTKYRDNFVGNGSHHLEACPTSSIMTAAVPLPWENHPIKSWAQDDANFSLSRDDPTLFDNTMQTEAFDVAVDKVHLTLRQIWKAVRSFMHATINQLNAAKASFLEGEEKDRLIKRIQDAEIHIRAPTRT